MRVKNESAVPAETLKVVRTFLEKRFAISHKTAAVLLTSEPDPQAPGAIFMTGDAYPNGGWSRGLSPRHFIKVYVPSLERPYPVKQQNPAGGGGIITGCPVITLNDWQEELVAVLAHELQHVVQYNTMQDQAGGVQHVVRDADEQFEVEAERVAAAALAEWRSA